MDAFDDDNFDDDDYADVFGGMLPGFDSENSISLEKAWHGLHFLLTGDPWGGSGHAAFLLAGGREVGEDMGYGPARVIDAAEVREIDQALHRLAEIFGLANNTAVAMLMVRMPFNAAASSPAPHGFRYIPS